MPLYVGAYSATSQWPNLIQPYTKSTQILQCPSYSGTEIVNYTASDLYNDSATLCGPWPEFGFASASCNSASGLQVPAATVWLLDSDGASSGKYHFYGGTTVAPTVTTTDPKILQMAGTNPIERHLGTTDVLWCGGHVKAMKIDALAKPRNATNANVMSLFTIADD